MECHLKLRPCCSLADFPCKSGGVSRIAPELSRATSSPLVRAVLPAPSGRPSTAATELIGLNPAVQVPWNSA